MTITAHISSHKVIVIEHETVKKSHLAPQMAEPIQSELPLGDGIRGAFNIITSNCELRHGLSAYAHSKETADNSMLHFLTNIQQMEAGLIGAGVVTVRRLSPRYETFYDELDRADAIDTGITDRWGHEHSALPKLKYGFDRERPVSCYTPDDGYSRLHHRERFVRDPRTFALVDTWR